MCFRFCLVLSCFGFEIVLTCEENYVTLTNNVKCKVVRIGSIKFRCLMRLWDDDNVRDVPEDGKNLTLRWSTKQIVVENNHMGRIFINRSPDQCRPRKHVNSVEFN